MRTCTPSTLPSFDYAALIRRFPRHDAKHLRRLRAAMPFPLHKATTARQRLAVFHLFARACADARENAATPPSLRMFVLGIQPTFACDGAIAVPYAGMWVCIERGGYAHT